MTSTNPTIGFPFNTAALEAGGNVPQGASSTGPLNVTSSTPTTTQPTTSNTAVNPVSATPSTTTQGTPGALSTIPGQQPGTTLTDAQMQAIQNQNIKNVTNPTLPSGGAAAPVNQQAQSGEMLSNQNIDPNSDQVNANQSITASTVGQTAQAAQPGSITAATYNASVLDPATLAHTTQAVTASLPPDALVSNQLKSLLTPDANGQLPDWVAPAVTAATQLLAGRGISSSSMAGQAITSAILTAAIPVATANANAELTAFTQNLSNEQAAAMQNGQAVVQAMLSNQGAENAASNFNATSTNQTNQFLASLASQTNQFNAAQVNAISQFNASQTQSASTSTAQLQAQLQQFNANMANQREQFNVQNAIIIQQSNAEYLRAINTANTAVQNQDNQLNAQNTMNMSDQAMANLQQEFNDNATMLYNSNMTAEEQNYAMTYLSQQYGLQNQLDQNITDAQEGLALNQQISTVAGNLFAPAVNAAGKAIGSIISGVSSLSGGNVNNFPQGTQNVDSSGNPVDTSGFLGGSTTPNTDSSGTDIGNFFGDFSSGG